MKTKTIIERIKKKNVTFHILPLRSCGQGYIIKTYTVKELNKLNILPRNIPSEIMTVSTPFKLFTRKLQLKPQTL